MRISNESPQGFETRKLYQLSLKFPKDHPPYKRINPYVMLNELNKVARQKYDIQFIQIRYFMTKNKDQKILNDKYSGQFLNQDLFKVDRTTNNIFSCQSGQANPILKEFIFKEADRLKPPVDYNPEQYEKQYQNQLKSQQMERLTSLKQKIQAIMGLYNGDKKYRDVQLIRSIQSFKMCNSEIFKENDYEIYAKALMNSPVYEKITEDSKLRDGKTQIQFKYRDYLIKVFLNPSKDSNTFDTVSKQYRINNWSLAAHHEHFINYFGTDDLLKEITQINNSINLVSSVSFNQVQSRLESLGLTTFLWNETMLKINVKMAQIDRVQKAVEGNVYEYYFHLKFPPMFYINQLKAQQANSEKFLKFFDRVTNFTFLDNIYIKNNHFLRYFLFNNSILRISLKLDDSLKGGYYYPVSQAHKKLQILCEQFKGTIKFSTRAEGLYKPKFSLKFLSQKMDYKTLKNVRMQELCQQDQDKIWIIKYLILVMVRQNYIIPTESEVGEIIKCIQKDKKRQDIDCYLYVLWKTATNMWGHNMQKMKFFQYFIKQCEEVKKMNLKNIMKRILYSSENIVYIFRASLTPSGILHNPPSPEMKGRLLKQFNDYWEFFIRVSITEESQVQMKNQKYITRMYLRNIMKQLIVLDRAYDPLGWSPSQLRSFSLWYFHRVDERNKQGSGQQKSKKLQRLERRHILQFLGDFSDIQNSAKKAARIGQSFSSSWTYTANNIKYKMIPDIYSSQRMNFTDGIGKISEDLLQHVSLNLNIRDLTVIQVRYLGAKGILVLDKELGTNEIQLRPSMKKYPCEDKNAQKYLDILDWNKYKAGYLNRQIIILLRTLGIDDIVFIGVQEEHIKNIQNMTFKDCSIFKHLDNDLNSDINNLQPANRTILSLLNAGFELQKQPFFRGVLQTLKKNGYHQLKVKSNIMIKKSARIIGIIDEDGILEENQVYCSIYNHLEIPANREVIQGKAIMTRNPCLHPADIRIVTCVGKKQISQRFAKIDKQNKFDSLWNVVIMPIKGKYPLTSQISGSDLDGDNFFICWDDRLIPQQMYPPNLIDQPVKADKKQVKQPIKQSQEVTYSKMLDFFIDYTNYEKLGQIDNSHLVHADKDLQNYANNKTCLKLADIHGKAVDFPKTGYCPPVDSALFCSTYPDFMQKQHAPSYISDSILGKLYRGIKQKINSLLEDEVEINVTQIDKSLISDYKFDETESEVKKFITILKQYQRQMTNLINLLGVDLEYQIYTGNFSAVKNKIKVFGKNRLVSTIISLRQRFFDIFFEDMQPEEKRNYRETGIQEKHMKIREYFGDAVRRQAQLCYLINYTLKFPGIKYQNEGYNKLKTKIDKIMDQMKIVNRQFKYCGFVWFIIPKIMLNLKITWRQSQKKEEGDVEKNNQQSGEDSDEYL